MEALLLTPGASHPAASSAAQIVTGMAIAAKSRQADAAPGVDLPTVVSVIGLVAIVGIGAAYFFKQNRT
jgi:hypothetical protein